MKKFLILVLVLGLSVMAYAELNPSYLSIEQLLNKIFNSTSNTIRTGSASTSARNLSFDLTINSFDTLLSANTDRRYLSISNVSNDSVVINLCSVGEAKKDTGILIEPVTSDTSLWEMKGAVYTGEICGMSRGGTSPKILVVEY